MTRPCITNGITVGLTAVALLLALALTPGTSWAMCDGGKEYISITSPLTGKKYYTLVKAYSAGTGSNGKYGQDARNKLDAEADKSRMNAFSIAFEDDWPIGKKLTLKMRMKFRR